MSLNYQFPSLPAGQGQSLIATLVTAIVVYATARGIYLLYFHPLSRFPGPRFAAISNIWYAYHWISGRWPFVIEEVLNNYGEIVRIAPNELAFGSPAAFSDIYTSHEKGLERFEKTDIHNLGKEKIGGIIWEQDPVKHRKIAKQMAPAFSPKATRAKDLILHKYADLFVEKMKEIGENPGGISLPTWIQWLSVDIAAEVAYSQQMNCMRDERDSVYLAVTLSFNRFVTYRQVLKRFPWLSFLRYAAFPVSLMGKFWELRRANMAELHRRLTLKGATEHVDYFEQLMPADGEVPDDPAEMLHLMKVSTQLLFAGYLPPSDWYYGTLFHLLHNRDTLDILTREIREAFPSYEDITPSTAAPLPYLNACLKEALRLFGTSAVINGMPVYSPGAVVDGHFIPQGTMCQTNTFAVSRNPRFFHDARMYQPQRWLPADHSLYDARFASDSLDAFSPFSQGPRICAGKEVAWWQARLVMAKILWSFDLQMLPGQHIDLDKDLRGYGYWVKPELRVRFSCYLRG
ncbi:hypothetical protein Hte_006019 [Hypoxylon texense]